MIRYDKLWQLLESRHIQRTEMLSFISTVTLAKLGKNQNVTTEIIGRICTFLNCQPCDIMEYVPKK